MSYFAVTAYYIGSQCNSIAVGYANNITACTDLETNATTYRKCTLDEYSTPAAPISYKTDCVSATSADRAFSQFAQGKSFAGNLNYNGTGCTNFVSSDNLFLTLNQCIPYNTDQSQKIYVSGNNLRYDIYDATACNGTVSKFTGVPIDTCIKGDSNSLSYPLYNKVEVYGNSALSGGASWGLVISLILLQLL